MIGDVISGGTLLAAFIALWITRKSWRSPLDRPAVVNVSLQCVKVIAVIPLYDFWLSNKLHTFTGVWNLEELISHLCYLLGMCALLHMFVSRLDMTPAEFRAFVRYRIELPLTLVIALMVALFVTGPGKTYIPDTVAAAPSTWLRAYFLVADIFISYLLIKAFHALQILRRDPRSRRAANSYLCAVAVSAVGIFAFQLEIGWLQWVIVRVEVVAYAIAATYTWRAKCAKDETAGQLQPN